MLKWRKKGKYDGYRIEDGKVCIDLSLITPDQLFDQRDPSPFLQRDLDDDAIEYIFSACQEFHHRTPMKINIYIAQRSRKKKKAFNEESIAKAIENHFAYLAMMSDKKLKKSLKNSQAFLVIGVVLLIGLLNLADVAFIKAIPTLALGLEISGWVALWRPIELLLFDWWPLYERKRTFAKLASIPVEVAFQKAEVTTSHIAEAIAEQKEEKLDEI